MRFSLKTLMLTMTYFALLAGVYFAAPRLLAYVVMLLLAIIVPGPIAVAILYDRGYLRAFCLGAILPAAALAYAVIPAYAEFVKEIVGGRVQVTISEYSSVRQMTLGAWALCIIGGLASAVTLRLIQAGQEEEDSK